MPNNTNSERWSPYVDRFRKGEGRAEIFRDMVLADAEKRGSGLTFLDIGCGKGLDGDRGLQESLTEQCDYYIGIEPDPTISVGPYVDEVYRCTFEEAPIQGNSVDIAVAMMVLEHVAVPKDFWRKLCDILVQGGVFWGFTVDARHFFSTASQWADRLNVKNLYLTLLKGRDRVGRVDRYPTYYRANTPQQIMKCTGFFRRCEFVSFSRVGELNHYVPRWLRPLARAIDRRRIAAGWPGSTLAVRLEK